MRPKHLIAGSLAAAVAAFALGPRIPIREIDEARGIPGLDDLDDWLAAREAALGDVVPKAEKTIRWFGDVGKRTPLSVVYLHGFTATRQETAPLSDLVAERLGANLFYTRLTGHGRPGPALGDARVQDWLQDALEAVEIGRRLGERVIVIGTSTGGTLATWLATRPEISQHLAALVLLSPNFGPARRGADLLLLPWGIHLARSVLGNEQHWIPTNERHGRFWTHRYPTRALLPMMGLVKLVRGKRLEAVRTPVFMAYSSHDRVIDIKRALHYFNRLGSPEKVIVDLGDVNESTDHVIAGEILAPSTTEPLAGRIARFIGELGLS